MDSVASVRVEIFGLGRVLPVQGSTAFLITFIATLSLDYKVSTWWKYLE